MEENQKKMSRKTLIFSFFKLHLNFKLKIA